MDSQADEKIEREKQFHNEWAKSIRVQDLRVNETFESPTAVENQYILKQFADLRGKRVLDLGCGAGESSVYFALKGAEVYACDIAEEFLRVARSLAERFNVSVDFKVAEAGNLPYPKGFFDFVYGNGILHHVELLPAAGEICRVLKECGKAAFIEPLPYNPIINLYRWMAKGVRTEDESPLSFKDLRRLEPYFASIDHHEFWFCSLLIFFHFYFVRRWDPSKVRYWKKVIEEGESYRKSFGALQALDGFFLKCLPFLKPLCWNTVLVAVK